MKYFIIFLLFLTGHIARAELTHQNDDYSTTEVEYNGADEQFFIRTAKVYRSNYETQEEYESDRRRENERHREWDRKNRRGGDNSCNPNLYVCES